MNRRRFCQGLWAAGWLWGAIPRRAIAHEAAALVVSCIDFRFIEPLQRFLTAQALAGHHDWTALAGASLAVTETFFDRLDLAYRLHGVRRVLICDHQDCGAYRLCYPNLRLAIEREQHRQVLAQARQAIRDRYPEVTVEGYWATLAGTVEPL